MKVDAQGQGGGRILDVAGQVGWGILKIEQFSETSNVYVPKRKLPRTCIRKNEFKRESSVQFAINRVPILRNWKAKNRKKRDTFVKP